MSHPLLGDPAALSALAATLRRTALQLSSDAQALREALEDCAPGWTGPTATSTRRRTATVLATLEPVAAALDGCGRHLQQAATELAATTADLRALEESASAAGFEVRDGRLHRAWGITGVADHVVQADGDRRRGELQERLRQLLATMGRHRAALAAHCDEATRLLGRASSALRA
ncbi:hypothetical protein [Janibacter anophelis]|uniref:hypothetical protein n=1 Tax=Janibacter anophelis TaxID=319054 RepID=UPI00082B45D2|nr:hypothetical protein [Janibacter anophelis]